MENCFALLYSQQTVIKANYQPVSIGVSADTAICRCVN